MRALFASIALLSSLFVCSGARAQLTLAANGHVSIGETPPTSSMLTVDGDVAAQAVVLALPPVVAPGTMAVPLVWDPLSGRISRHDVPMLHALVESVARLEEENRRLRAALDELRMKIDALGRSPREGTVP